MKNNQIIVLFSILLIACNDQLKSEKVNLKDHQSIQSLPNPSSEYENFDSFFSKFIKDSSFQISRIKFPLKVISGNDSSYDEKVLIKNEWVFTSFGNDNPKVILNKEKISKNEIIITYSLIDTGVLIYHYFKLIDSKWYLILIKDFSD